MNHSIVFNRDERGRILPSTHCINGHELTEDNLYHHVRSNGRKARYCRICRTARDRKAAQALRKVNRQKYYDILKASKCVDCGESRPATLSFDHIDPSTKSFTISDYLGKKIKWDVIYEEMAKCEVRCANCHSVRTAEQFGWYQDLK